MDTLECIATKFDVREFNQQKQVPWETKEKILQAARMTGTGLNTQHWRFILIEKRENLALLAEDSTSGKWVSGANFAVIIATNPSHRFHALDAGRALQDMQLAAWDLGVASGIFTGVNEKKLKDDFGIPADFSPTVIVGFGFPASNNSPKRKNRRPLGELAFAEKFGAPLSA